MGLDAYLVGIKTFKQEKKDRLGYTVTGSVVKLAYWRNHRDLHKSVSDLFPEARPIESIQLTESDVANLIKLVSLINNDFFVFSTYSKNDTIKSLKKALKWLKTGEPGISYKTLIYESSW